VRRVITIDELVVGDPAEAWRSAGFHVDADGVCRIGRVRVRLAGSDGGRGIRSWSLRGIDPPDGGTVDGLPTGASTAEPCEPASHPNGVVAIDHVVLLTPDPPRTVGALGRVGLAPRGSRTTDTYGAPMLQTFFRAGEVIVELIGPEQPAADADGSPAAFFGLAHTVADLDATVGLLGDHLGRVKDAVQPGRRITTLRHRNLGMSVATAFMSA
jgi:hypothetical protein